MTTEESQALTMIAWYQEQHRMLRDRCDILTVRVRRAEAEAEALRQRIQELEENRERK